MTAAQRANRPDAEPRAGTVNFMRRDRRVRRWLVGIGVTLLTLTAVATLAFVALLHLARLEVLERLQDVGRRTQRTVVVDDVRLGLDGTLELNGLRISAPGEPGRISAGMERLTAHFDVAAVLSGSRRPDEVVLRGLWADVNVRGGRLAELDELREALGRGKRDGRAGGGPLPRLVLEDARVQATVTDTPPLGGTTRLTVEHLTGTVAVEPGALVASLQGSVPGPRRVGFRVSARVTRGDAPTVDLDAFLDAPLDLPPLRPDAPRVRISGLVLRSGEHVGVTGLELFWPAGGQRLLSAAEVSVDLRGGLVPRPEDIGAITAKTVDATLGERTARASLVELKLAEAVEGESGGSPKEIAAALLARAIRLEVDGLSAAGDGASAKASKATLTFRAGGGRPEDLLERIEHALVTDLDARAPGGLPRLSAATLDVRLAGLRLSDPVGAVRRLRLGHPRVELEEPEGLLGDDGPWGSLMALLDDEDPEEPGAEAQDQGATPAKGAKKSGAKGGRANPKPATATAATGKPARGKPATEKAANGARPALGALLDRLSLLDLRIDEGELVLRSRDDQRETVRLSGVDAVLAPGELPGALRFDLETHVTEERAHTTALRIAGSVDSQRRLTSLDVSTSGRRLAQMLAQLSEKIHVVPTSEVSFELHLDPTDPERPVVTGRIGARDMGIDFWRIAHSPVTGITVDLDFTGAYDRRNDTLDVDIPRLRFGEAELKARANVKRASGVPELDLHVAMPKQDCAAVARSIPKAMIPRLGGLTTKGTIWFDLKAWIDLRDSYTFKLDLDGDLKSCSVVTFSADMDVEALNSRNYVNDVVVNGQDLNTKVGPGTKSFTSLKSLPEYVGWGAIATEDLAFYHHSGFQLSLIKRAVKMDLDYGRYVYGGSTLSQQLVKNLFLSREKTLSRKAEEAIIVWHMEQRVSKERILELYLNCIEYGPEIWGITRAARHYFDKRAQDLTPLETAFLMGLKPCPRCGYSQWKAGGLDARGQHRMEQILTRLRDRGWITNEQFEESRPFLPAFYYPGRGLVQLTEPRVGK